MRGETRGARDLAQWLTANGVTQAQLAARLAKKTRTRLKQGTVSSWVAGRHIPRGPYMVALLNTCGIAFDAWVTPLERRVRRTGTEG